MTQLHNSQPWTAIATTPSGLNCLIPFCQGTNTTLWASNTLGDISSLLEYINVQTYTGSLREHLTDLWSRHRGFVFCLATGAVLVFLFLEISQKLHNIGDDAEIRDKGLRWTYQRTTYQRTHIAAP